MRGVEEMEIREVFRGKKLTKEFERRFGRYYDELKWLYFELYSGQEEQFIEFCRELSDAHQKRSKEQKRSDQKCESDPNWYQKKRMTGMKLDVANFAETISGLEHNFPYFKKCGINYIQLMPIFETAQDENLYVVTDYRKIKEKIGTMKNFCDLLKACKEKDITVGVDYAMDRTSREHEWAKRARAKEERYQRYYILFEERFMSEAKNYEWKLNYQEPSVLKEIVSGVLYLAELGIDVFFLEGIATLWQDTFESGKDHPKIHNILRILRISCEIVCPGILLIGNTKQPQGERDYLGTEAKPECHLLKNDVLMASLWNTVATQDVRLLKTEIDRQCAHSKNYINYLRDQRAVEWDLDYTFLRERMMEENAHRRFLNEYFLGKVPDSDSTGELYAQKQMDFNVSFCGMTASMCGIEQNAFRLDKERLQTAIDLDIMLHAMLFFLPGDPVLYSGDEVAEINDWNYKDDLLRREDARSIHRGKFDWKLVLDSQRSGSIANRIFYGIWEYKKMREEHPFLEQSASICSLDTGNDHVLALHRWDEREKVTAVFNFARSTQTVYLEQEITLSPYTCQWIFGRH